MDPQRLIPGDATLIENIVNNLKAKGIFDQFRHECLADVDTKSSCQNLSQRVDGYTSKSLGNETWHPDLNKNELRNKLRRNIDESGMITVGADHVVEQVINPKIHQLFLPKIVEVVHQYIKEQTSLCSKKPETCPSSNETTDSKTKTSISDPIADILSFTYSNSKPSAVTNNHIKTESVQQKQVDLPKPEKKKEDKPLIPEKNASETLSESIATSVSSEMKPLIDKEKIKKELEISPEVSKKLVKEESKAEKKKMDDAKAQTSEVVTSVEDNKPNTSTPTKPLVPGKRDHDKNKQKIKSSNLQKSSNSSNETKKPKKELEKISKTKAAKSPKEPSSPVKSPSLVKTSLKEEKIGENSKAISSDSSSTKGSDSPFKKNSKSNFNKIKHFKHKGPNEKNDKSKISKLVEKSDQDSSNIEKGTKSTHYSSSYDSSQGSDQEKSSSSNSKNEKPKHFSKSAKKENTDKSDKTSCEKKKPKDADEGMTKKTKNEKISKLEKLKEVAVGEAAKISSRSNSFGSTSSISSSSNTSKDNLISNSDEGTESSGKDKKKRQTKEKDSCQNPDAALPPPPPPPPPSSTLISEATSSAEMSSVDDQSSCDSEASSSREISEGPLSDSDIEQSTLDENVLNVRLTGGGCSILEHIFLSSSASEFEGFDSSPEKIKDDSSEFQNLNNSDVEVSSVHTSDLSNYDDGLSDDDFSLNDLGIKKQLTLKEAQELIENKALLQKRNKKSFLEEDKSVSNPASPENKNRTQSSSSFLSSLENSPVKGYTNDSDVSVSSVHTSDLSSFNDELSDDGLFSNESSSGRKKRLTLKEAEELIRNKAVLLDKINNSPSESNSDATPTVPNESSMQKTSLSSDEESLPVEPKRLLRRERKLNPRYASSEYTSIFNCKKETFITKQSSPLKNNSMNTSVERKCGKKESSSEKSRSPEKSSVVASEDAVHQNKTQRSVEAKNSLHNSKISSNEQDSSNSIGMSSSDDIKSVVDKEKIFEINNKPADDSDTDHLKMHVKLKVNNNSKLSINSNSLKRKLSFTESTPLKRPCSRSSVDSSSSELVPNENKPFNSDKQNLVEDKILRDNKLKGSDLSGVVKKDLFSKQKSNNNNGDVLGQKDHFPKNSYGRTTITEKKTAESDSSKELNAL